MNITIAANLKYFNLSTPWPMEQEPGFIVLLYEYFYAG